MKNIFSTFALALVAATSTAAACEYKDHNIDIHAVDYYDEACDGVINAIRYFEGLGYTDALDLHLDIVDEVLVQIEGSDETYRVFGMYHAGTDTVQVSTFGTDYIKSRDAWLTDPKDYNSGMDITLEIWQSVITHEIAHQIIHKLWASRNPYYVENGVFLGHGIHEFIAYRAQLTMLSDESREEIIASYGNLEPLKFRENMNGIKHSIHPHRFGVQSYLTPEGDEWTHEVFEGKIVTFDQTM